VNWVKTSERKPEPNQVVLFVTDGRSAKLKWVSHLGLFDGESGFSCDCCSGPGIIEPPYWAAIGSPDGGSIR
jgi:hypothetical protein